MYAEIGNALRIQWEPLVKGGDGLTAEGDGPEAIGRGRADGNRLAHEGFADREGAAMEVERAARLHLADDVPGAVLNRWQNSGEGTRARLIATGGHGQVEGLVGAETVESSRQASKAC